MSTDDLHPLVRDAARGRLPAWSRLEPRRREHAERVGVLLERWATARGETPAEVTRWTAAGWLHDALRDEDPEALRARVEGPLAGLPGPILHGPAAAARLRRDGVADEALLRAVAYHTLGHGSLDALGRALYCADFLEPGRDFDAEGRAALRARMPDELDAVTAEVAARRVGHLLVGRRQLHPATVDFWNGLVTDEPWERVWER